MSQDEPMTYAIGTHADGTPLVRAAFTDRRFPFDPSARRPRFSAFPTSQPAVPIPDSAAAPDLFNASRGVTWA